MIGYSSDVEPRTKRPHTWLQIKNHTRVDSCKTISRLLPYPMNDACHGRGAPPIFWGSSVVDLYTSYVTQKMISDNRHPMNNPMARVYNETYCNTRLEFQRFRVKEPRH